MNPKEVFHNTASSVQLPYIDGHSVKTKKSSLYAFKVPNKDFNNDRFSLTTCKLLLKKNKKNDVNLIVNNRPDRFLFSLANVVLLHFIQPVDFNLLVRHFIFENL